jgi:hypothetical protein
MFRIVSIPHYRGAGFTWPTGGLTMNAVRFRLRTSMVVIAILADLMGIIPVLALIELFRGMSVRIQV